MPQPVTPASAPGALTIFPGNLSGIAAPDAEATADFAELLRGSQNINGVPGGIATGDATIAFDGENDTATGLPSAAIAFISDNENGEPVGGDARPDGEEQALLRAKKEPIES